MLCFICLEDTRRWMSEWVLLACPLPLPRLAQLPRYLRDIPCSCHPAQSACCCFVYLLIATRYTWTCHGPSPHWASPAQKIFNPQERRKQCLLLVRCYHLNLSADISFASLFCIHHSSYLHWMRSNCFRSTCVVEYALSPAQGVLSKGSARSQDCLFLQYLKLLTCHISQCWCGRWWCKCRNNNSL